MKSTTFARHGDGFIATWAGPAVAIQFTRIRETDSGMLYAELAIRSDRTDARGTLLSPSRVNLMAATERKRLADLLVRRAEDVDWANALESVIGRVIREWRTPEPLVDLWDVEDPGENTYLLYPYLVENDTNLWYADEQSLKSYLAMVCSASIVSGQIVPAIGTPTKTGPVLYYDWETFDRKQRRRLTRVANGFGGGALRNILYRRMTRSIVDSVGLIRAEASKHGAVLVIFDSLGWMCNGDINKPEIALPAMNGVGSILGTTRLVLAHHGKAGRGDEDPTVFGSAFFEASSRNRWLIRKAQDEGADTVRIGLYHKKASDDQRFDARALAFTFDRFRDAVTVEACELDEDPRLLQDAGPDDRIVGMLRETELYKATVKDIAKETKITESTVKRRLLAMEGNRVQRISPNGLAGGRGHAAEWALLAQTVQKTVQKPFINRSLHQNERFTAPPTAQPDDVRYLVSPDSEGPAGHIGKLDLLKETDGFSALRAETVHPERFRTVSERFSSEDEDDDELPW